MIHLKQPDNKETPFPIKNHELISLSIRSACVFRLNIYYTWIRTASVKPMIVCFTKPTVCVCAYACLFNLHFHIIKRHQEIHFNLEFRLHILNHWKPRSDSVILIKKKNKMRKKPLTTWLRNALTTLKKLLSVSHFGVSVASCGLLMWNKSEMKRN